MKNIILGHKFEKERLLGQSYIPRVGLEHALPSIKQNLIKVITGPRRAGKSVFCLQMLKEFNFAYVNFDDERLVDITDYDSIIKGIREIYGNTNIVLFDEIQNLSKWELFVNRLQRNDFNIILTGSNSRLLSAELSTHLTGRYVEFHILPFSFTEFLKVKNFHTVENQITNEDQGRLLGFLSEYIERGGLPEILLKSVDHRAYLRSLFESILFKDITKRYSIRYPKLLYNLALYLVSHHSRTFTYSKLRNNLGFRSIHTVQNYVKYLEEAYIVFCVKRYSHKLKEQLRAPEKVYVYDTGMTLAVKFAATPDYGWLIENIVAIELLRRKKEIYYFKNRNGAEVDFVVKQGLKVSELIQVCYDISDTDVKKREVRAIVKANKELSADRNTIITWDFEAEEKHGNYAVSFIPLWRWLLYQL
jgi:predicted AAA+ superfamily ATPase